MIRPGVQVARATARFSTESEGGRSAPINDGYRGLFVLFPPGKGTEVEHDFVIDLRGSARRTMRDNTLWLPLGVEDEVLIAPFAPERVAGDVMPNTRFVVLEGRKRIGAGRITSGLAPLISDEGGVVS